MKSSFIAIAVVVALALNILAEQTNRVEFVWDGGIRDRDNVSLPALIHCADVAGIGEFINQPLPAHPYAYVKVDDYWVGDPGTNVVKIVAGPWGTDWVFPTNTPIVFFALSRISVLTRLHDGMTNGLSQAKLDELLFPHGDDAWFRTTRDNGMLYTFATNLWECQRVNPDHEQFYEVLRDADKLPYEASSRIRDDTVHELGFLLRRVSDTFLLEKNADPLIGSSTKGAIFQEFLYRGWSRTNGVYYPPPVQ